MAFFWFFIVLVISHNQGAARPTESDFGFITKNGWDNSKESSIMNFDDGKRFLIPTRVKKGLFITIKGTLNTNDKAFIIALPSTSGGDDCLIKMDFENSADEEKTIVISPGIEEYESTPYPLSLSSGESPSFELKIRARVLQDDTESFGMNFFTKSGGESSQLICFVKDYDDIKYIEIREGVAHVDSLLFEFE